MSQNKKRFLVPEINDFPEQQQQQKNSSGISTRINYNIHQTKGQSFFQSLILIENTIVTRRNKKKKSQLICPKEKIE